MYLIKSLNLFCGSSSGNNSTHIEAAKELGKILAQNNISLIFGGASVGLMDITANAVLQNGGKAIGIFPDFFPIGEIAHQNLTEMIFVKSMAERKYKMAELSDAFLALPGGYGTLDELFEMMTFSQLDLHRKPVAILNSDGFYDGMLSQLHRMEKDGLMKPTHRQMLLTANTVQGVMDALWAYVPPVQSPWMQKVNHAKSE